MKLNEIISNGNAHVVGLCAGRHDLPVSEFIYSEVADVLDFGGIQRVADAYIAKTCKPHTVYGCAVNSWGDTDIWIGDDLHVVVTGLTACTAAVIAACACNGVNLTLWHFDRNSGDYVPQAFRFNVGHM